MTILSDIEWVKDDGGGGRVLWEERKMRLGVESSGVVYKKFQL